MILREPLVLGSGAVLGPEPITLAPDFRWSSTHAAIYVAGSGVRVRKGFRLYSGLEQWQPHWNLPIEQQPKAGVPRMLRGITFAGCTDLDVESLDVRGFPTVGAEFYGTNRATLRNLSGERCFQIFGFGNSIAYNTGIELDGLSARDTWGPGPGVWEGIGGYPSRKRPGGWSGGDGLAGYFWSSKLRNLDFGGELFSGFKLVRPRCVLVSGLRSNTAMIQGFDDWRDGAGHNADGIAGGAVRVVIEDVVLDKRLGEGALTDVGNSLQISFGVKGLEVRRFSILADGNDGHGVQVWGDCEARFRDGVISGFNGTRGGSPAYAIEVGDRSSINADFSVVNQFHNQDRIVLQR